MRRRLRDAGYGLGRIVLAAVAISAALVGVGSLIALLGGRAYQTTIASTLFIAGGGIFVWNGIAGGGARGRRLDGYASGTSVVMPADALAWVGVGVLVIGAGVIAAIL